MIAVVGSIAYMIYALTVRDSSQAALLATGAFILAFVFGAVAVVGLRATWNAGSEGRTARAFAHAIVGGVAAIVAFLLFAGAFVLASLA
jgi:hypothetical protein